MRMPETERPRRADRSPPRFGTAAVSLLIAAVVLAGCGDDDKTADDGAVGGVAVIGDIDE